MKTIVMVFLGLLVANPAFAQIQANGSGSVSAKPDMATVHVTIVEQRESAIEAFRANSAKVNMVFANIKEFGISMDNVKTDDLSIYPEYTRVDNKPPVFAGYVVRNGMSITIDDVTKVGNILDAVISSGVNQINGIAFSVKNKEDLIKKARILAVIDARSKAQMLANSAGVKLGSATSISESATFPRMSMNKMMSESGDTNMVAEGKSNITINVNITFDIDDSDDTK